MMGSLFTLTAPLLAQFDSPDGMEGMDDLGAAGGIVALLFMLFYLAILLVLLIGAWKVFTKAGQPGWGVIIPIFNVYLLCKIVGRPAWWIILFFIPVVNVIVALLMSLDLAKAFGKSAAFGIGIFFLGFIFMPILGFGSATYQGPVAGPPAGM